jgi:hypothetical protein
VLLCNVYKRSDCSASAPFVNGTNRPPEDDLSVTFTIKKVDEKSRKLEQDIKRALELSPHQKPLERG